MILPSNIAPDFLSIFRTREGHLVGNHFTNAGNGRYFDYDIKNRTTVWGTYLPEIDQTIPTDKKIEFYYSFAAYNNEKEILGTSLMNFKRIDFNRFSDPSEYYALFKGDENKTPLLDKTVPQSMSTPTYYTATFGGKKFLYSLCVNSTFANYANNRGNMELHVFNWDGTLKKIVLLNYMHLGSFVVDEKNKYLYVMNFSKDNANSPIIKFNLAPAEIL